MFVRSFLADYARNPYNLLMLVLVPVVFVIVAAPPLADAAGEILGGPGGSAARTAAAGWAAGFIAANAMYFQVRAARAADRRLVGAGLSATRLVTARMVTGLALALLAAAAALTALGVRSGVGDPGRAIAGTLMFSAIYLAIGAFVGTVAADPVNGTTIILFVWAIDVFFGPAMGSADWMLTRVFPTHYVTLWMVDLQSGHAGRAGDLGWALVWTVGALAVSWTIIRAATRVAGPSRRRAPGSWRDQLGAGSLMGIRTAARNPVLWALLVVVPVVFVLLAVPTTPDRTEPFVVREAGLTVTWRFPLRDVHPGLMAPIAVASLATLVGLLVFLDASTADRRLRLAGFRPGGLLLSHLMVVSLAALVAVAASLAVTAAVFDARRWGTYAAGLVLIALTYALVGVLLGPLFGRVAGVFIAFMVPFLDLGIEQSAMLRPEPAAWARALPGYGGARIVLDGALTTTFDEAGSLTVALAWLAALALGVTLLFRRKIGRSQA